MIPGHYRPFCVHCLGQQQRVLRPGQEAVSAIYCSARRPLGVAPPHPAAMPHATWSRTMPERCTLDGFVITPIEPQGSLYAGTDHGRLFINEARTGVMAWWSMGRWTDRAAREAIIAHAMTMTLADFRRWFARHAASCLVD